MDLIAGLKSELFRPLVTLFLPGAVAVGPYILLIRLRFQDACNAFWKEHPVAFMWVVLISVLAAGLVLEDLGARIEGSIWDKLLKREFPTWETEWHEYLSLQANDEIVGQRYLNSILIRMKFELSMSLALLIHAFGLAYVSLTSPFLDRLDLSVVLVFLLGLASYLLWESWASARLLVEVRRDVITACAKK